MVKQKRGSRWEGVDNVRAIAMLAVFTVHSVTVLGHQDPRWLMELCRFGTDLFLLLSGCLIHHSIIFNRLNGAEFLRRRIRRIYPTFLAMLALYVFVLFPLYPSLSKFPPQIQSASLMVVGNAAILPLAFGMTPIITVSWTLGYICLFYVLAYPLIRSTRSLAAGNQILLWSVLTVVVFVIAGRPAFLPLGVILSNLLRRSTPGLSVLPFWGAAVIRCFPVEKHLQLIGAGIAAFTFCWWMLQRSSSTPATGLLSRISYSFYLTHGLAILAIATAHLPLQVAVPAAFALALAMSAVVHVFVEQPFSTAEVYAGVGSIGGWSQSARLARTNSVHQTAHKYPVAGRRGSSPSFKAVSDRNEEPNSPASMRNRGATRLS